MGPALFLLAVLVAGGCRSLPFLRNEIPLPPLATDRLLDGDVFLTRSPSPVSAVFAWHPHYHGSYSHAALFYRRPDDGTPMLLHISGKLTVSPVAKVLPYFARVRVLRDRRVNKGANPLLPVVRSYDDPTKRRQVLSLFDQGAQRKNGERGGYTCVAFANVVYKEAGLNSPFAPGLPDPTAGFLNWYYNKAGSEPARQTSPNSALSNPHFDTVLTWRNPRVSDEWLDLLDEIADSSARRLGEGYAFRVPSVSSQCWFSIVSAFRHLDDAERRLGGLRIQYIRLVQRVQRELDRRRMYGELLSDDRTKRRKTVREIFNAVFTEYMVLPEHPVRRPFE